VGQKDVSMEEMIIAIGLTRARLHLGKREWIHLASHLLVLRVRVSGPRWKAVGGDGLNSRQLPVFSYKFEGEQPFIEMTMNWR
jgi:hypothetical protein